MRILYYTRATSDPAIYALPNSCTRLGNLTWRQLTPNLAATYAPGTRLRSGAGSVTLRPSHGSSSSSIRAFGPGPDIAVGASVVAKVVDDLGLDALTFLATTVVVVPTSKFLKISPILGFLFAGLALNQLGLIQNVTDIAEVSQLGILFLLFEMGLELSLERLQELATFAFGLGLLQIILCTAAFTIIGLPSDLPFSLPHLLSSPLPPPLASILQTASSLALQATHSAQSLLSLLPSTNFTLPSLSLPSQSLLPAMPPLPHLPPLSTLYAPLSGLTLDEDIIIALALSLSSSAFVLNVLSDQKALKTRRGSATLGMLLMQDIAVVPLLAVLPVLEASLQQGGDALLAPALFQTLSLGALKGLASLGAFLFCGQYLLRGAFRFVEDSESPEAFLALSLLTVTGTALATERLGFSDSLGAFLAGAILASTNHKEGVQQYTGPLERLLLGLFFLTTGTSIDLNLLQAQWPSILAILGGLLAVKTSVIAALGPRFGLDLRDSVRTAFLMSQGGEFAFVVLALANQLGVLPTDLNRLLIIVVVLSMALTPALDAIGSGVGGVAGALADSLSPRLSYSVADSPPQAASSSDAFPGQKAVEEGEELSADPAYFTSTRAPPHPPPPPSLPLLSSLSAGPNGGEGEGKVEGGGGAVDEVWEGEGEPPEAPREVVVDLSRRSEAVGPLHERILWKK